MKVYCPICFSEREVTTEHMSYICANHIHKNPVSVYMGRVNEFNKRKTYLSRNDSLINADCPESFLSRSEEELHFHRNYHERWNLPMPA